MSKQRIFFLIVSIVIAAGLWTVMFSPAVAPYVNFWGMMCVSAVVLVTLTLFARVEWWKSVPQVDMIYGIKSGISPVLLSFILVFLIGPAEEIFWRGYVQRTLSEKTGKNAGFVLASLIYAGVHVPSCNFMLVMAALVAGLVWGLFYRLYPEKFAAVIISHALWDAAVFVWFPI